jgi:hypothetical protein
MTPFQLSLIIADASTLLEMNGVDYDMDELIGTAQELVSQELILDAVGLAEFYELRV